MRAAALVLLSSIAWAASVSAAEPEAVHLVVEGPTSCASEGAVRAELARIDAPYRDAADGARARTFTIAVEDGRVKSGRLVVRDLVGVETTREVKRDDCASTLRALALFVALALDEETTEPAREEPTSAPVDMAPDVSIWPAPAEAPPPPPPPDRRAGGIALSGFYGGGPRGSLTGVHLATSLTKIGRTRFGAAGAVWDEDATFIGRTHGTRLGGLVSWGAPWNDVVAGFSGELGVAAGSGVDAFTSPYVGWSLVLQVPWKIPVRPVGELSAMWLPTAGAHSAWAIADIGVAWQAW